jgi:secreted trypsin-like serine protease
MILEKINEECAQNKENRIKGGKKAEVGQFPFMALLIYEDELEKNKTLFGCGGTLITRSFILTAAHCTSSARKKL